MSTTTTLAPPTTGLTIDRRSLLSILEQARALVPGRCCKPIFAGVRFSARDGWLQLQATDGDVGLTAQAAAEGLLPPVVVPCQELIRRLRASKEPVAMLTVRGRPQRLVLNGGRVEHALCTLSLEEFPPVADGCQGEQLTVAAAELREALAVTSCAIARWADRYAINGVLLESDDQGARLAATDGHRLAVAELRQVETQFRGQVILPAPLVKLVQKFTAGEESPLTVAIRAHADDQGKKLPSDLYVAGTDWTLSTQEPEGRFPLYRDVIPDSASRFVVERSLLLATLQEVMLATGDCTRGVAVSLRPRSLALSASSDRTGSASAKLPARFLGGGDSVIHTGFNPDFLLDALKTLPGERIVIDVAQNGYADANLVHGKPALLQAEEDDRVRWVIMPMNLGYPTTRAYLGSNFKEELADAG